MAVEKDELARIRSLTTTTPPSETAPARSSFPGLRDMPPAESEYPMPSPTGEEYREAMYTGAGQGAVKGTAVTGGAMQGFRTGLRAPVPLPLRPATAVGGALVGGMAGFTGSELLDSLYFDEIAQRQRPEVAPYREGAKTWAEVLTSAPHLMRIPVMQGNKVAEFISEIGKTARARPKTFVALEGVSGVPAGVAGGVSYAYDPEATGQRFLAETGAAMLTPTRLVGQVVGTASDFLRDTFGKSGEAGRALAAESKAARHLQEILMEYGEDIPKLIRMLEKPLPGTVTAPVAGQKAGPTAAQKTGSQALAEIETALGNMGSKFGAETTQQGKEALRAYMLVVQRLIDTKAPGALVKAAEMRDRAFQAMIEARIADADKNAAAAITKLKFEPNSQAARAEVGRIINEQTSWALESARQVERELWQQALGQASAGVPKTQKLSELGISLMSDPRLERLLGPEEYLKVLQTGIMPKTITTLEAPKLRASNTYQLFLEQMADVGNAAFDRVPPLIRGMMQELGAPKGAVLRYKNLQNSPEALATGKVDMKEMGSHQAREIPVKELINYRSDLLAAARTAAATPGGDPYGHLYGLLAESLLNDINKLQNPAFDAARSFSRQLNDTFTRTYARTATEADVTRTGAQRVTPEILVSRAFGSNSDVTAQRMLEIEDASRFLRTQYDQAVQRFGPNSPEAEKLRPYAEMSDVSVASIQDSQARILRLMASQIVDPLNPSRLDPKRLQRFVNDNRTMLDKAGLTNDLQDSVKAEMLLRQLADERSQLMTTVRDQQAFAKILKGGENPTLAVTDVLNSRNPVQGIKGLIQFATESGPQAVAGLRASLMDYAFTRAGGMDRFDPKAFQDVFFQPLGHNKPSLANLMRQNGLMNPSERRAIVELTQPMLRIQAAIDNKAALEEVLGGQQVVYDFALKLAGGAAGKKAAGQGGPTLLAASAGSKVMRDVFEKMPAGMLRSTMEQAMRDPELLALLLKKPTDVADKYALARTIVARLSASGAVPAATINLIEIPPAQTEGQVREAARKLRGAGIREQAPPLHGVPGIMPVAPPASVPGRPPAQSPAAGKTSMGPANQKMYEALFPQDTISSLMAMQPSQG